MKATQFRSLLMVAFALFTFVSCNSDVAVTEGKIVYAIDYPDHKDNFILYSILPKRMDVYFKGDKIRSKIEKANMSNSLLWDCNAQKMNAYFSYGNEVVNVNLTDGDVQKMMGEQPKYTIKFTEEKDTISGFNVKKAIATSVTNSKESIALWYTDEIKVKNSNWYNPFKEVPGFLLAYEVDRFGIRMQFRAIGFEDKKVEDKELSLPTNGVTIPFSVYNQKLTDLFKSFE